MSIKTYHGKMIAGAILASGLLIGGIIGLLAITPPAVQTSATAPARLNLAGAASHNKMRGRAAADCFALTQPFTTTELGPAIPEDAYSSPQCPSLKPPDAATRIKLQRIYDTFSWRSFLAINWPIDLTCNAQGCQTTPLSQTAPLPFTPQWAAWKEGYEIFKQDGSAPAPWNAPRTLPTEVDVQPIAGDAAAYDKKTRLLFQTQQANSNLPLWDQNGNRVYYEVLVNQTEFDYIRSNQLYHLQGQINYYQKNVLPRQEVVVFIPGSIGDVVGVVELKLAWKIMTASDIAERYYTMNAYVFDPEQSKWAQQTVGLVGLHIAHKTLSSTQWVWSTFAHIDNLQVNDMAALAYLETGKTLRPSFTNPYTDNLALPVNVLPDPDLAGAQRTQVLQVLPIAESTTELNQQVQELLQAQGSVWQYYELIGTQYSTDPLAPPASPAEPLPASVTNRSGGKPSPAFLVNPIIETYDQEGNQEASDVVQGPLNNAKQLIFGTQSCMGCHFSAGIARRYVDENGTKVPVFEPGTADFSYLLTRAQWQQ